MKTRNIFYTTKISKKNKNKQTNKTRNYMKNDVLQKKQKPILRKQK